MLANVAFCVLLSFRLAFDFCPLVGKLGFCVFPSTIVHVPLVIVTEFFSNYPFYATRGSRDGV